MTVRFDTGQKDRRRHAVVVCGGISTDRPGCGRELDIDLGYSMSDAIAELAATEVAVDEHGWASDFPAWWTMMVTGRCWTTRSSPRWRRWTRRTAGVDQAERARSD